MQTNTNTEINHLLKLYKRYIITIASSLTTDEYVKTELIQEGEINLYKASINYSEDKGNLHAYILTYLRYGMLNYLTTYSRTIKIPANKVHQFKKEGESTHIPMISLDKQIGTEDNTNTLNDLIEDHIEDNSLDDSQELIRALLRQYLSKLKPKWQTILNLRYIEEKSITEISEILGISKQTIDVQITNAINELQKNFGVTQQRIKGERIGYKKNKRKEI